MTNACNKGEMKGSDADKCCVDFGSIFRVLHGNIFICSNKFYVNQSETKIKSDKGKAVLLAYTLA